MASKEEETKEFTPPTKIEELYKKAEGNKFASINRPTAGPREERALPVGSSALQLYSLATPNGWKVGIILEELGVEYDAHFISIMQGDQFTSGFVNVNPNSKIPALVDNEGPGGRQISIFESGPIMMYLARKFKKFLPDNEYDLVQVECWVAWQLATQGVMTGNFGHFFVYAPKDQVEARNYGVARYGMEVQRLCDVLDRHLQDKEWIVGDQYTVADMIIFPWFHQVRTGYKHSSGIQAGDFLSVSQYKNALAWADRILARPAVQRGLKVCSSKPNL
mmetsp:Transcript_41946/g.58642  ORF Transcript_41946/g.58642 Transcript_41946/m.58642 type:complete len:277 (+) Transcript_41946:143-973(+)|eukprot:CAMPEP_0201489820 /NCGR_PEP_ID=MMETSP0151_2-20130828/23832_1 /ASSEMBLY_ACC=CAM_ASM_000257 /TAXON_ID=200890 /ORGANISM="Paramoeba atlantica, Strain 621/1 / CCAP 1560/9" /LENGTH=276 /DNA_ID=CAMNT_0047875525 /DNA_START=96 /DNA_END=926 /DNA_ORIENTATION=+